MRRRGVLKDPNLHLRLPWALFWDERARLHHFVALFCFDHFAIGAEVALLGLDLPVSWVKVRVVLKARVNL